MRKGLVLSVVMTASAAVFGVTDKTYMGINYSSTGDIVLGEWTSQFRKAKQYAEDNQLPLVVFWGNGPCPHCKATEKNMAGSTFVEWQQQRGLVMAFTINGVTEKADAQAAFNFTQSAGNSFPYLGIYWPGHTLAGKSGSTAFYMMPDKSAKQVIDKIDTLLADYVWDTGSTFAVAESDYNRYEAEAATRSVTVELVRRTSAAGSDEQLKVSGPDGAALKTYTVTWPKDVTNRLVDVEIPAGVLKKAGDRLTLSVDGKTEAEKVTHVTYVDAPVSSGNPLWDTERSAEGTPLGFGEWTFDLEGAKALAQRENGYTLVMVTGSQWCPNCYRFERNFLELTNGLGEVRFEKWARENKIALAVVDVPYLGGGKTDTATLLSRRVFSGNAYVDDDGKTTGVATNRSGLGYLSRKGVDEATANARLATCIELAGKYTSEGGFLRPEDTEDPSCNGYRPRVPCFCLLRPDGTCAARMTRFTFPKTPYVADRVWFDNYLKRFDEMLANAADATEVENDSAGAGSVALVANGGTVDGAKLCAADLRDSYRLTGLSANAIQKVVVKSAAGNLNPGAQVTVSYWRIVDGVAQPIKDASASGRLSEVVSKELAVSESGDCYVQVSAKNVGPNALDPEFNPTNAVANNFTTYSVAATVIYNPGEGPGSGVANAAGQATVRLVKDEVYYFDGLDSDACATVLAPVDEGTVHHVFRALVGGDQALAVSGGAGKAFGYQLWHPGTVGFEETGWTVVESVNDRGNTWLDVPLKRFNGASGAVRVCVTLDEEATTLMDYLGNPRYELLDVKPGETSAYYDWENGVRTNVFVRVRVLDDVGYDGDGQLVLKITQVTSVGDCVTVEDGRGAFTLTVKEDDKADVGRAMVTRVDPYWAKKLTVYAHEDTGAKIWAKRIEASDGLAGVEVKSSVSGVAFATENPRDLEVVAVTNKSKVVSKQILWWSSREMDEKYLRVSNVPAGKSAKITLNDYAGFKTVSGSNTVTVVSVAADAPEFETADASATLYRYVSFEANYGVVLPDGSKPTGALSFAKVSGSLPSGLTVSYDAEAKAMKVSGAPTADTKTGRKSFEAIYQVTEARTISGSRGTTKVPGLTIRLAYDLVDPALAGGGETGGEPLNAFFNSSKACTYADIPVVANDGLLLGTLQVTVPRTGKASAKLVCTVGSISLASKSFEAVREDGTLVLNLASTTKAFPNALVHLEASDEGELNGFVAWMSGQYTVRAKATAWSKATSAEAYQGQYTVAMPVHEDLYDGPDVAEGVKGLAPRGTPYLSLKMTSSSQWNAGKMTWAGVLANGTAVSGTAVLSESKSEEGKDVALLPVVKYTAKDFFSALPQILRGAKKQADEGSEETCFQSITAPTVKTVNGSSVENLVRPYWYHTENSTAVTNAEFEVGYNLNGAIFNLAYGLDCCCQQFVGPTNLQIAVTMPISNEVFACELDPVDNVPITVQANKIIVGTPNPNKMKLSVNSSGVVSGTFNVPYVENGKAKTLSAAYRGVILIGWSESCGCGSLNEPFIQGSWTYADKLQYLDGSGKTKTLGVKRGDVIKSVK